MALGELARRSASGFPLAGGLAALVLLAPEPVVLVLLAGILLLAAAEWSALAGVRPLLGVLAQIPCLAATWAWLHYFPTGDLAFFVVIGLLWFYIIFEILKIERLGELDSLLPVGCTFTAGLCTLSGMFGGVIFLLQTTPEQIGWTLPANLLGVEFSRWLLAGVLTMGAFADIGGYFIGRKWGSIPLSPVASPGKTWQGFIGSLLIGLLLPAALFPLLLLTQWLAVLAVAVALISLGLFGDLWESLRKRYSGTKDSGHLLAGHGGVLDRIDSHLCAVPVLALLISLRALLL